MMEWLQDITIYHKEGNAYIRYNVKASVRNTSIQNRTQTGITNTDKALIRVFDYKGYNNTWKVKKGDIIVNKSVSNSIVKAPLTELRQLYGDENVWQVISIDQFIFNDEELPNHIKIGAI